jgi:fluoride exporter
MLEESGNATTLASVLVLGRTLKPWLWNLLLVMCGGGLGAACRYATGVLSVRLWGTAFPWGTLTVNLVGCFLIGLLFALADRVRLLSPDIRLFLIIGFLGGLTTFSAFTLESIYAGRNGAVLLPLLNVVLNNLGGLSLTFLGMWLGSLK